MRTVVNRLIHFTSGCFLKMNNGLLKARKKTITGDIPALPDLKDKFDG